MGLPTIVKTTNNAPTAARLYSTTLFLEVTNHG